MIVNEIEVKDIMTKTNLPVSDFAVNPYVGCTHACKYCYASFMKRFTNHPEPWGEFVDVKRWPEIDKPGKYAGKEAFFCSVTDPYQPLEKRYGRTRALLEQLLPTGIGVSISTKSDLILRDLDLIKQFPSAHVSWSINTLDEDFRREMDRAVSIERRFAAMEQFYRAGIQTTCFISPIFPGTVLSKFQASVVHNLIFAAVGIIGNLIGTMLVQRIVVDGAVLDSIRALVLKLLLFQSLCAILLLVVSTFRSKSLGMILAVLFGLGLTSVIHLGINAGLRPIFGEATDISKFMPDAVMGEDPLDTVKAIVVAVVTGAIFLPLAIRIFDRRDVK